MTDFVDEFNSRHSSGFDLNGNPGGDFFTYTASSPSSSFEVDSNLQDDITLIAAALSATSGVGDAENLTGTSTYDGLIDLDTDSLISGVYTPSQYITLMYSQVARDTANAKNDFELYETRMDDMFELRSSISGVDLDEEAARLMEFQASYEASARVLSVTNQLIQEIMNVV